MNLGDIITAVRTKLSESASVAVEWTDAEITAAINEGLEEISDYTEWLERMTPIKLLARQVYVDLRGIGTKFPVLSVMGIFASNNPRWLQAKSIRELDGDTLNYPNYPQWEGIMALSRYFMMRGLWWLGFHPGPSADGDIVRVFHSSLPLPLVLSTDEPGFPEEFHLCLVYYACYEMHIKEKESGLAIQRYKEYETLVKELRVTVKNRNSIDHVTRMSEEAELR